MAYFVSLLLELRPHAVAVHVHFLGKSLVSRKCADAID